MIFFPNCKINIGLFITAKREDGYHNLQSIFYPLGLKDTLECRLQDHNTTTNNHQQISLTISGLGANENILADKDNSVIKAYTLIKKDYPSLPKMRMHLHKSIPCFAGLGGGSSDGTAALKLIDFMAGLNLSKERLIQYASQLGSDNIFFVENKPMLVYGRGEKMSPCSLNLKGKYILLVKPDINISTKEAYQNIRPKQASFDLQTLKAEDIAEWKDYLRNDFEEGLFARYPVLGEIKQSLYNMGALYAQMSGSGSTLYAIFDRELSQKEQVSFKQKGYFLYQERIENNY